MSGPVDPCRGVATRAWARAAGGLAAVAALGGPAAAGEIVFADADLHGWRQAGIVSVEAAPGGRDAAAAVDGDRGTSLLREGPGPVDLALAFTPAQQVRRVRVWPGSRDPVLVRLTVVDVGGGRFAAGEHAVEGGRQAVFRLLDVDVARLEVSLERLDGGQPAGLAEVEVSARLEIESIALQDVPETIPEGGGFPIRVTGRDVLGGQPDLTDLAQLRVTPARALALTPGNRAVTLQGGPITIAPQLGALQGAERPCLVQPLQVPPTAPTAWTGHRTVTLALSGPPPFQVLRRLAGAKTTGVAGRTDGHAFHDADVIPGRAYQYSARRIDRFGNPLSLPSAETRVRTALQPPPGLRSTARVPLLVALFVDSLGPGERDDVEASLRAACAFVWRHSGGGLLLDPTFLDVRGPTPPTEGPTMAGVARRLSALGVEDNAYGVVFAVAGDLPGGFGGFRLLGATAGAMGRDGGVPTPAGALGPDPGAAWSLAHELWHVVGQTFAGSAGLPRQPSGHLAEDARAGLFGPQGLPAFDRGDAWDGLAALYAGFDAWDEVGWPYRRPLEVLDTDGDGLPDDDPRLPLDERRLGSDPSRADTDGDGLPDLAEVRAGLYRGSDPTVADTDGDGLDDGLDPWPLSDFTGTIARGRHPLRVASLPNRARAEGEPLWFAACWNESGLHLEVTTAEPRDLFLDLDGSGALGRWLSDRNTGSAASPATDVWCGPARIAIRTEHPPLGVFVGERPVPDATAVARRIDGLVRVEVTLPPRLPPGATDAVLLPGASLVTGLPLHPGARLGLALVARPPVPDDPHPFEPFTLGDDGRPAWTSLFETHRLFDATLAP